MVQFDDLGNLFENNTSTQPQAIKTPASPTPSPNTLPNSLQVDVSLDKLFGPSSQGGGTNTQSTIHPSSPQTPIQQTPIQQTPTPKFHFAGPSSITKTDTNQHTDIPQPSIPTSPIHSSINQLTDGTTQPAHSIPPITQPSPSQTSIEPIPAIPHEEITIKHSQEKNTPTIAHTQEQLPGASIDHHKSTIPTSPVLQEHNQAASQGQETPSAQIPLHDNPTPSPTTEPTKVETGQETSSHNPFHNDPTPKLTTESTTLPKEENTKNTTKEKNKKTEEIIAPDLPPMIGSLQPKAADMIITSAPKKKLEPSITTIEDIAVSAERKPDIKPTIKRTKINPKVFLFGCIGLLFLMLLLVGGGLFYFLAHPQQLNGIMDPQTVAALLKIITTVFFGFLFFLGFGFLTINLYRLIVLKNVAKMGFGIGAFIGGILVIGSLVMGKNALDKIFAMDNQQMAASDDLLFVNIPLRKNNEVVFAAMHQNPGLRLIAPIQTYYELNNAVFPRILVQQIGSDILTSIQLECGNGQILPLMAGGSKFDGYCYFLTKGEKTLNIVLNYNSRASGAPGQKKIPFPVNVASEIILTTSQGSYTVNEAQTEISFGKAPQRLFLDARNVFTDLALPSYRISWDTTNDGEYNIKDLSSIVTRFNEPGTQTVRYTIPDIGDFVYPLTFKIEQSDVPICQVKLENIRGVTYNIIADCEEENGPVVKYDFAIINENTNTRVDLISSRRPQVKYDFPSRGNFLVRLSHSTQDGKIGFAESDTLDIGDVDFTVSYDMFFREANDRQWRGFDNTTDHVFSKTDQTITLQRIPVRLQMRINGIIPVLQGTNVSVFLDNEPIIASDDGLYAMTITNPNNQVLKVIITNQQAQAETTMEIPIIINQPKVIPALTVTPDYVGESPFTVTFDASATSVTDPDDQIVFFSWDFGDGKINKNTSQGIIQHQYSYNDEEEMGVFNPVVTIQTRKGLTHEVHLDKPITVTKPTQRARINIDSHPSQSAFVGEDVTFSIRTDGVIDEILWDFDDGETLKLNGRQGVEVTHAFTRPGRFRIRAQVTYDNKTIASPTIVLVVNEKEK
ncbi:MAG: PKD domain-containing protein [Candidatus Absconditabacterales bacterium]|nr:PKD domain-containing protein [Candidatus Absconditabacterales bacterium]